MRKFLLALFAIAGMAMFTPVTASAAPSISMAPIEALKADSLVQEARVYCYNRYSGRFLHWGSCGGYRVHRYYRPRYRYYRPHYRHHRRWHYRYY